MRFHIYAPYKAIAIDREKLIIARGLGGGGKDKKAKGIRRYNVIVTGM